MRSMHVSSLGLSRLVGAFLFGLTLGERGAATIVICHYEMALLFVHVIQFLSGGVAICP